MKSFSEEINNFQTYGTYEYVFDAGGNLVFKKPADTFSEQYCSIPLIDYSYDETKIHSFYQFEFKEFIPTTVKTGVDLANSIENNPLEEENKMLKDKLLLLTEIADSNQTQSDILATKQIILELRIALKQGFSERDFSEAFPYLPLTKK